jgi:hypothetical protein
MEILLLKQLIWSSSAELFFYLVFPGTGHERGTVCSISYTQFLSRVKTNLIMIVNENDERRHTASARVFMEFAFVFKGHDTENNRRNDGDPTNVNYSPCHWPHFGLVRFVY